MEQKLEKTSQCKRKLELKVPEKQAEQDYYTIVKKYRKHVNINGFRKGKAPLSTIENMLKDKLKIGYIEEFAPKYYKKALNKLEEENIIPVNQGQLTNYDWDKGKDLILNFSFEVAPEVELNEYKKFSVEYEPLKVSDEMVNDKLKELQQQYSQSVEKEGKVAEGDLIYYTIQKLNGKEVEKKEDNGYKVGQNRFGETFDKDLVGAEKGDVVKSELQFQTKDEQGEFQKKSIELIITSIKKVETPKLDDEFAKDVGDYENLSELKKDIRKEISKNLEERNENNKNATVLKAIIDKNPFEIPGSLVENYVNTMINQSGQANKIDDEQLEQLKNMYRSYAEKEIQTFYVMKKLRELEDVEVSEEEIENQIAEDAKNANMEVEKYKKMYGKNIDNEKIKTRIKDKKILKNICENVKFKKQKKEKKSKQKKKE